MILTISHYLKPLLALKGNALGPKNMRGLLSHRTVDDPDNLLIQLFISAPECY